MMAVLPANEVKDFVRRAGAQGVTLGAGKRLASLLEERAEEIAARAIALARYAKRKTVTAEDVRLASELLKK